MPRLEWDGKKAVENYHLQVPYHVLREEPELSAGGEASAGNLLVQGDNLVALKALLPYYRGQVKCIYIDPPYNTGNEGWIYNDNVNSPVIKEWLGKAVGKEAEDFSRHDKWLCMMYPRLKLLREFLREDGLIFVNLDDTESASARLMLDDIFGAGNFLAVIAWEKRYTRSNNARMFYSLKDSLLIYRRSPLIDYLREARTEKSDSIYKNPDKDSRGVWTSASYVNPATKAKRPNLVYPLFNPFTGEEINHPTHAWKYEPEQHAIHVAENRLWWGRSGEAKYPRLKVFPKKENAGLVPVDVWKHEDSGTTDEGGAELKELFGSAVFDNPKPTKLIRRVLQLATNAGDIILDSFAGSGTTGHAVLQMNKQPGGNRRCLLVEMEPTIARNVTAERLRRVAGGYRKADGSEVPGLGGGFRFVTLGEPIFAADGTINPAITFSQLARHVWFEETREPLPADAALNSPFLGVSRAGLGVYLLFNGILKDRRVNGGNILTRRLLASLPPHAGPKVFFAAGSRLDAARLREEGITFKQTPYQITGAAASAEALADQTEGDAT